MSESGTNIPAWWCLNAMRIGGGTDYGIQHRVTTIGDNKFHKIKIDMVYSSLVELSRAENSAPAVTAVISQFIRGYHTQSSTTKRISFETAIIE